MYPGVRNQAGDIDSQQQKLDLLMEEKSIISQLFEPDTIDVRNNVWLIRSKIIVSERWINLVIFEAIVWYCCGNW